MKVPAYAAANDIVVHAATFTMEAIIKVPSTTTTGIQTIISKGATSAGSGGGGFFFYWDAATNKPVMWIGSVLHQRCGRRYDQPDDPKR